MSKQQQTPDDFVPRSARNVEPSAQLPNMHRTRGMVLQHAQDFVLLGNVFFHESLSQGVNPAVVGAEVECSIRSDLHRRVDILTDVVTPENRTVSADAVEEIVL